MKCKKFFAIALVVFLVVTSVSAVASARLTLFRRSQPDEHIIKDIGTVIMSKNGNMFIEGISTTDINGKDYYKYRVMNVNDIDDDFKVTGLKVKFTASVVPIFLVDSPFISLLTSLFKYLPINIITIEKYTSPQPPQPPQPPLLIFELKLEESYSIEDPILLEAKITNKGEKSINLCDIGLEKGTLDLVIEIHSTSEYNPVHYIGPTKPPEIRELPTGETITVTYDLKKLAEDGMLGRSKAETCRPFNFEIGSYQIKGVYDSFDPAPHFTSDSNLNVWKGTLETHFYEFVIEK